MKGKQDLLMGEYLKAPGISRSGIVAALQSGAHYKAHIEEEAPPTAAMVLGSAVHCAVLEPPQFAKRYVVAPEMDRRTKAYKAWKADQDERLTILSAPDGKLVEKITATVKNHPVASRLLDEGIPEQSYFWEDSATGLPCKVRPDWVRETDLVLIDLKTCLDGSFGGFQRAVTNLKYHIQAAYYLDGVKAVTGNQYSWVFLAVEKAPPFAVALYTLDKQALDVGRELYRMGLRTIAECQKTGVWTGYPEEVQELFLPPWADQA